MLGWRWRPKRVRLWPGGGRSHRPTLHLATFSPSTAPENQSQDQKTTRAFQFGWTGHIHSRGSSFVAAEDSLQSSWYGSKLNWSRIEDIMQLPSLGVLGWEGDTERSSSCNLRVITGLPCLRDRSLFDSTGHGSLWSWKISFLLISPSKLLRSSSRDSELSSGHTELSSGHSEPSSTWILLTTGPMGHGSVFFSFWGNK